MNESINPLRQEAVNKVRLLRSKVQQLSDDQIGLILSEARSHYAWQDKAVPDSMLQRIFDIAKMGPTSMNCCPVRFVFIKSLKAKQKLAQSLKPTNVPKVMQAPITAIIGYDVDFWKELLGLFPHEDRRHHFSDKPEHSEVTAFRNSTLQGAYFMIAARALGLDVGAISGFDNKIVDELFFKNTTVKSNFLCNIGYADEEAIFQRLPRFNFEDVCQII